MFMLKENIFFHRITYMYEETGFHNSKDKVKKVMGYFAYKGYNVFYEETGQGPPLLLLHGNTASSRMFDSVLDLYTDDYTVIIMDFLGHGRSSRLPAFTVDLWYDQAMQVVELIKACQYGRVNIIGTSGGALAAINVALERGDLVNKVVADSFEGEESLDVIVESVIQERKTAKSQEESREFWQYCHGDDWESVVDNDTAAISAHNASFKRFFHRELSRLSTPIMLTASLEDEFAQAVNLDFRQVYAKILSQVFRGTAYLFNTGGHPAMLSNPTAFAQKAKEFFQGIPCFLDSAVNYHYQPITQKR